MMLQKISKNKKTFAQTEEVTGLRFSQNDTIHREVYLIKSNDHSKTNLIQIPIRKKKREDKVYLGSELQQGSTANEYWKDAS